MTRYIDLTFPIHTGMTTFPRSWHPKVEITQLGSLDVEGRETRKLVIGTHSGTHCDAPRHFIEGGETIDNLPLNTLIGPALLADFSDKPKGFEIGVEEFRSVAGDGPFERIAMRFDWDRNWGSADYYGNHPYISKQCARWLVSKGLRLLAMDTPMPDNPRPDPDDEEDSPIHKILLGNDVILVEYLCNLHALKLKNFTLIALPMKIEGADGSPVRCVAVESAEGELNE